MIAAPGQVKTRGDVTDAREPLPQAEDFAAALDWWREAGVDHDFADTATDWLAAPAPKPDQAVPAARQPAAKATPTEPAAAPSFGGDPALWPRDLAAFRQWWLTEPAIEDGGIGPRVAPRGEVGAALMIVVAMPGEDDTEMLLAGPQGRLIDGFLRAAGIATDGVYLASVLGRYAPLPDLTRAGLAGLLQHHAGIVAPRRILALGRNILPLFAHEPPQGPQSLPGFNHDGRNVPLMEARGPAELLRSARARADLWQRWLEWTYA